MITKVEINNFRCFNNFLINEIAPITLIAGLNNVGKSSLLESIFLFYYRNISTVFFQLNLMRQIQPILSSKWLWKQFFLNMNMENDIIISIFEDNKRQNLVLSADKMVNFSAYTDIQNLEFLGSKVKLIDTNPLNYVLQLKYNNSENNEIFHYILFNNALVRHPSAPTNIQEKFVQFISPKTSISQNELAEFVGKLDVDGNKDKIVKILRLIEPRILDLSLIPMDGINSIFIDIGLPSKLPLSYLGDGIVKIAQIALIMLANPGSLVLIDEIEEGFHFKFYPKLWEIIGILALQTNNQVFATTHSYECIKMAKVLYTNEDFKGLFRYIRLDRINGVVKPVIFSDDNFEYAIENDIEVR
jgi:AAA15 family ATPase/GTPase